MAPVASMVGPKTPKGEPPVTESNQNIQVFVRCRPIKPNEKKNMVEVVPDRREIRVNDRGSSLLSDRLAKTFTFDNVFTADTKQIHVYKAVVAPLIDQVLMGYNCTVFAYGQTGTGKTYTMEGERSVNEAQCSWEDDPLAGIIPRALHQLFSALQSVGSEHTVRVSFLELYNEELYDLLSAIDDTTKLKIYEDNARKGSIIVGGLEELTVQTKAEIYEILRKGSSKRQTAATLLNVCSSRSHTIFSVTVHIKENSIEGEEMVKIGKLNLVDLAGSENIGRSGAIDKRAREAGNINQSLLTLGRVITALVEKAPHIPYRESKLTRLLQDSLGGRTKTSIIATISPDVLDVEDTLSTLDYAHRAKKITNKPEINQKLSKKTLLREFTSEIERLRRDLAACREKNGIYINEDNYKSMQEQIKKQNEEIEEKCAQILALSDQVATISKLFDETKEALEMKSNDLEQTNRDLKMTSNQLLHTKGVLNQVIVDRDEHKHLLNVHVKNEELLSSQANQLLDVADKTTNDVLKLHEKVDRQQNIESLNKSLMDEFQEKFANEMQKLEELVKCATNSYNDSMDDMRKAIEGEFNNIAKVVSHIQTNKSTNERLFNEHSSKISSLNVKDRITLEKAIVLGNGFDKMKAQLNSTFEDMSSQMDDAQIVRQNELKTIASIIAESQRKIEDLIMRQSTFTNSFNDLIVNQFKEIKSDLFSLQTTQNDHMMTIKSEMERIQNEFIQAKESKNLKWKQLKDILDAMEVDEIKSHHNFIKSSNETISKINEASASNEEQHQKISQKVDSFNERIETENKFANENIGKIDELSSQNTQQLMNECNFIVTKDVEINEKQKQLMQQNKESVMNAINESSSQNNHMILMIEKQLNEKETLCAEMKKEINSQFESQEKFFLQLNENMNKTNEIIDGQTKEVVSLASTMEQAYVRHIENNTQLFERFVKFDILKDTPTGQTPERKEYRYPRNLVATSPHERILERYRAALDLNEAVKMPLPEESDSEFLSDSTSSEAGSSNNSIVNDENSSFGQKKLLKAGKNKKDANKKSGKILKKTENDPTFPVNNNSSGKLNSKLTPTENIKSLAPLKTNN